jgi:hypothetical protein
MAFGAAALVGVRLAGAADDPAASLETAAGAYLQAIADGEADRASELSPARPGQTVAPQAVLESALRIHQPEVGRARVDGAQGSVDVEYRVGDLEVHRALQASLTPAGWRLTTSLAEAPDTRDTEPAAVLRVGGVPLRDGGGLLLYPGVYRLDVVEGPLFAWGGDAFAIDGDPVTRTSVQAARELMPSFRDRLTALGLDVARACRELEGCPVRTAYDFELAGEIVVLEALDDGRAIELKVPLVAHDAAGWEWRDVIVGVTLDVRGLPVAWRCSWSGVAIDSCGP